MKKQECDARMNGVHDDFLLQKLDRGAVAFAMIVIAAISFAAGAIGMYLIIG